MPSLPREENAMMHPSMLASAFVRPGGPGRRRDHARIVRDIGQSYNENNEDRLMIGAI